MKEIEASKKTLLLDLIGNPLISSKSVIEVPVNLRTKVAGRNKRNNLDVLLQSYFIILKKNSDKFKLQNLFQEYKRFMAENGIDGTSENKNQFIMDLMKYAEL